MSSFVFPSPIVSGQGGNLQANSGSVSARQVSTTVLKAQNMVITGTITTPTGSVLSSDSLTLAQHAAGDIDDPDAGTGLIYVRDDDTPIYRNSAGTERTLRGHID